MSNKVKVQIKRASRKGKIKPSGIMIITVPQYAPAEQIQSAMKQMHTAMEECDSGKNVVIAIPYPYSVQYIRLR